MSRRRIRRHIVVSPKPPVIEEKPKGFFAKLKDVACNAGESIKLGTSKAVCLLKVGVFSMGRFSKERALALKESITDLFEVIQNFRQIQDECLVLAKLVSMNNDKIDTIDRLEKLRKQMLAQVVTIDRAIKILKEQPKEDDNVVKQPA